MRVALPLLALLLTACQADTGPKDYSAVAAVENEIAAERAAGTLAPTIDEKHRANAKAEQDYKARCKADPTSVYC